MDELQVFTMCRDWLRSLALAEQPARQLGDGSLWQPLTAPSAAAKPVLHASDALAAGVLEVSECLPAQVGRLMLQSTSTCPVYVPHGLALEGGAQNRIVDLPVWLEPYGRTLVEVSCVERRRWDPLLATGFHRTEEVPWSLRSGKLARQHRARSRGLQRANDQRNTWDDVRRALASGAVRSPTEDLLALASPREVPEELLATGQGFAVSSTRGAPQALEVVGCGALRRVLLERALTSLQRERGTLGASVRTPSAWQRELAAALDALSRPRAWSLRRGQGLVTVDVTAHGGVLNGTLVATSDRVLQLTAWASR